MDIDVLYKDDRILAVRKLPGMETIVQGGGKNCFSSMVRRGLELPKLAPVHRLDRDTSGVQLFVKDKKDASRLEDLFRKRLIAKKYLAICLGVPRNESGTIRRNLSTWQGGRRPVQVVKGRGGLEAVTDYELLCSSTDAEISASLILFKPHHGRTHQIRVHAAAMGRPVLCDDQYGERPGNSTAKELCGLSRQALHAWQICFQNPFTKEKITITDQPLPDMAKAMDYFFSGWQAVLKRMENKQ